MSFHCTTCGQRVEYSPEKGAMVDISGATYCPDLEPHRISKYVPVSAPAPNERDWTPEQWREAHHRFGLPESTRRLSADAVFRAATDSLTAESYDVEAGWQRFRNWLIDQGYVVPDDAPPFRNPREDQEIPHGTTHRPL
jgi:hypothetical protein